MAVLIINYLVFIFFLLLEFSLTLSNYLWFIILSVNSNLLSKKINIQCILIIINVKHG